MSSSCLINRLNDLIRQENNVDSVENVFVALEVAIQLAEDAITEVVATELAIDSLLEPAVDSSFLENGRNK